ncbi:hypothetical protein [Amycolatopsis sp. NPDC059021]|uniref:hypothetical protein n=1 Tax=Amycolatopsis sp. NPDC059021 TaxID=3346704 RepID=UPI0036725DFF
MQTSKLIEALEQAELVDVKYTRLSAEAYESDDEEFAEEVRRHAQLEHEHADTEGDSSHARTPDQYQRWQLMLSGGDGMLDVGICLKTTTARSNTVVEAFAHYHVDFDLDDLREPTTRETVFSYAHKFAYPALLPYVREAAEDISRRLRIRPPDIKFNFSKFLNNAKPVESGDIE